MKQIFTDKFANTQNVEDFRSRILPTDKIHRSRLIKESEKLTKFIIARLLKNINYKKNLDMKMFNADRIVNNAKSK